MLSLTALLYADTAGLSGAWNWLARSGVPAAAILMPAGFFFCLDGAGPHQPEPARRARSSWAPVVLAFGLASLGVGLLTA